MLLLQHDWLADNPCKRAQTNDALAFNTAWRERTRSFLFNFQLFSYIHHSASRMSSKDDDSHLCLRQAQAPNWRSRAKKYIGVSTTRNTRQTVSRLNISSPWNTPAFYFGNPLGVVIVTRFKLAQPARWLAASGAKQSFWFGSTHSRWWAYCSQSWFFLPRRARILLIRSCRWSGSLLRRSSILIRFPSHAACDSSLWIWVKVVLHAKLHGCEQQLPAGHRHVRSW